MISFTPGQLWTVIIGVCSGICTISAATIVIINWFNKMRAPEQKQNDRIDALEEKVKKIEDAFYSDDHRLKILEEGNRITQEAILALLAHGIDGNDIDALKSAKDKLHKYLINKEVL